jgi:hypothetical protein
MTQQPLVLARPSSANTCLHDLLRLPGQLSWRHVLERTATHPHEAATKRGGSIRSGRPRYPLQLALSRFRDHPAPPEVIRALIDAYPAAVAQRDEIGNTPLYYATTHSTKDVVQMVLEANPSAAGHAEHYYEKLPIHVARDEGTAQVLLDAYPKGVATRCHLGQLPLHRACLNRDASPELCRLLVEEGLKQGLGGGSGSGGVFVRDHSGKTPLDYLCEKIVRGSDWGCDENKNTINAKSTGVRKSMSHFWQKLTMLLGTVLPPFNCRDTCHNLLTLHAAIQAGCSCELIEMGLQEYPNQVFEMDCLGRSCAAIAAGSKYTSPAVIEVLLQASEAAKVAPANTNGYCYGSVNCVVDRFGKHVLHHAAESGRPCDHALHSIVASNPSALHIRDCNGNYPVMSAAMGKNSDIGVIFYLLREAPSVLPA